MPNHTHTPVIRATILLVDDDRRLLHALSIKLGQVGIRCISCDNVSEALNHFTMEGVDLVITDLSMPEIDGAGFVNLIRSQSDVPIVVVTGHSDEYAKRLAEGRDVTIIRKPCEFELLLSCVTERLQHAHSPPARA